MRLIGNKRKLVGEIERVLAERGIRHGTFIDVFSGTATVGTYFKSRGFRVLANDLLPACYAQAVARVEVCRPPRFCRFLARHGGGRGLDLPDPSPVQLDLLREPDPELEPYRRALAVLNHRTEPREGLIFRNYSPGGPAGRMYFTDQNGRRIDGLLHCLRESLQAGFLNRHELHLLLASLLDAADRVANISGTYGAFLKSWQESATRPLLLEPLPIAASPHRHRAYQEDANRLVRRLEGDVLYIDPPYNHRQYAANYHVLQVIAEYHRIGDLEAYERSLYGATGLRPYDDLRSAYCVPRNSPRAGGGDVWTAFLDLVTSSRVRHVVVSYNQEGLLSRQEIGAALARFAGRPSFDFDRDFLEIDYKRFRSDRNREGEDGEGRRSYQVLAGRERDTVGEWLFFATREPGPAR